MTVEGYIHWFTENMTTRIEPKFQIENWRKEIVRKIVSGRVHRIPTKI